MSKPGITALTVRTFEYGTPKETALKPLEEAAEVYGAWQKWDAYTPRDSCREAGYPQCNCDYKEECATYLHPDTMDLRLQILADEIADCIQVCCNLAERYRIDLQDAMDRCFKRNHRRGRV